MKQTRRLLSPFWSPLSAIYRADRTTVSTDLLYRSPDLLHMDSVSERYYTTVCRQGNEM